MKEGKKFDQEKCRLDLIPAPVIWALGWALTHGAQKYGSRNWEQGIEYSRVYGAILRHLTAWFAGENVDKDSGIPHLWLALTELVFLVTFEIRGYPEHDNRVKEPGWVFKSPESDA